MRFIIFLATLFAANQAFAYTKEQNNVLNHAAQVIAAAGLCPALEAQTNLITATLVMFGLSNADLPEVASRALKKSVEIENLDRQMLCLSAKILYGPKGENVPGLLLEKAK